MIQGLSPGASAHWFALDCATNDASCNTTSSLEWKWLGGVTPTYADWISTPNLGTGSARLEQIGGGTYAWAEASCTQSSCSICQTP